MEEQTSRVESELEKGEFPESVDGTEKGSRIQTIYTTETTEMSC